MFSPCLIQQLGSQFMESVLWIFSSSSVLLLKMGSNIVVLWSCSGEGCLLGAIMEELADNYKQNPVL